MQDRATVLVHYNEALDKLVARLEQDYYVLAAVLYGSLVRGEPWEKSDIDLFIVVRDGPESRARPAICLTEDNINISAEVYPRSRFRQALESAQQGSLLHSIRSQCRLLFSKDPSIETWLSDSSHVGARDQDFQLLHAVAPVPYLLNKVQKWLYAKHDVTYSFLWLMHVVNELARVEVVLNGEAPGREALDQALIYNPDFFKAVYLDTVTGPKTEEMIRRALQQIDDYLMARSDRIFAPLLSYLAEAEDPRTSTELESYFRKKVQGSDLGGICDWLTEHGIIERLTAPVRLTRKSLVELDEPAFYYDTDDISDWE